MYKISVKLLSDAMIGSGEGFCAIIDTDVVFDEIGIPYIPGRRIKGCLRDSANEVLLMFKKSNIQGFIDTKRENGDFKIIGDIFGTPDKPSALQISNLTIADYENNKNCLKWLIKNHASIVQKNGVMSFFTSIRQQTKINEDGVAEENSLRTIRAVKKGNVFEGYIKADVDDIKIKRLLWLACLNLRHIGTKRNRGFGEVKCALIENNQEFQELSELEGVCRLNV